MRAAVLPARAKHLADSDEWARLQTARGLACILLVMYHVVGNAPTNGMRVSVDSDWRIATLLFEHMRMPLFAFLSGFVYAYRPVRGADIRVFGWKKIRRLLVPMVVVSTLFFAAQSLSPGVNATVRWSEIWHIYIYPYAHFWFLQAMVLIFAVALFAERWMFTRRGYFTVLALALAAHIAVPLVHTALFSVDNAIYLAVFFFLGLGANRYRQVFGTRFIRVTSVSLLAVLWTVYAAICITHPASAPHKETLFGTALSLLSCIALIHWIPTSSWLAWVGGFSFTIYLYHVFFTAAIRAAMDGFGDTGLALTFVFGLVAGISGPILLEQALRRWRLARQLLLGQD